MIHSMNENVGVLLIGALNRGELSATHQRKRKIDLNVEENMSWI